MKTIGKIIFCALLPFSLAACKQTQTLSSFHSQPVECLGVELDGSQTLRSSGSGKNRADAIEQARKNAVWAVIFNGVRDGRGGCEMRPLVNEANAREKYAEYFNIFFADGGEYRKYVTSEDEKRRSKDKSANKYTTNYRVTVHVLRSELQARLKEDNILR